MPRGRKGRRRGEQVELTGLDAKLYWENRAELENAQERLWDVHAEVALELASAIRDVLSRNAHRLCQAADEFNSALDDVAVQLEEVGGGLVGEGPDEARDSLVGVGDRLFEGRVLLSPVSIEVDEVEFEDGHLVDRSVDLEVRIPRFGRAVVRRAHASLDQRDEPTVWDTYYDLPLRPDSGEHY